jgi:hypothetical protein
MGKLGKLSIVIGTVDKFSKTFSKAKAGLAGIGKAAKTSMKALGGISLAFGTVATAITLALKGSFQFIDALGKTANRTGVSVNFLQAFQIAAEESGSSTEGASKALEKFSRNIGEAGRGLKTQADIFRDLGVELRDQQGNLRGTEEVLLDVADGIQALGSNAEKNSALANLFGREGIKLFNVINSGSEGVRQLTERLNELGISLSEQSVRGVEAFNDSFNILTTQLNNLKDNVFVAFTPVLQSFTNQISETFKSFIKEGGGAEAIGEKFATAIFDGLLKVIDILKITVLNFSDFATAVEKAGLRIAKPFSFLGKEFERLDKKNEDFKNKVTAAFEVATSTVENYKNMIGDTTIATNTLTGSTNAVTDAQNAQAQALLDLQNPFAVYKQTIGDLNKSLQNLGVGTLKKFEDQIVNTLKTGKAQFKDFADFVVEQLIRIAVQQFITSLFSGGSGNGGIFSNLFGGGGNKKFVGFEKGGTVSSGRPYMVGEKGAELFVPSRTGTIVPNNQLGMAGGGVPVNITYQIQSFDSKDTLQAITENAPAISGIIEQQFNRRGKRGFTV